MMNSARFVDAKIDRESTGSYDANGDEILTKGNYVLNFDCNGERVALVWDVAEPKEVTLDNNFSHVVYEIKRRDEYDNKSSR